MIKMHELIKVPDQSISTSISTCGTDQTGQEREAAVLIGIGSFEDDFGLAISLRLASWSGKMSSGLVVWTWFQSEFPSGRRRVDPVHGSVSLSGTVGLVNLS